MAFRVLSYGADKVWTLPFICDVAAPLFTGAVTASLSIKLMRKNPSLGLKWGLVSLMPIVFGCFRFCQIYQNWMDRYADSYVFYPEVHCSKLNDQKARVESFSCNEYECQAGVITDIVGDCSQMALSIFSAPFKEVHNFRGTASYHCHELGCDPTPYRVELVSDH